MKYIISYQDPHLHFIDLEFIAEDISSSETLIQLPAWRPGRYELGNFAKNVQKWTAFDENGKKLTSRKISKDRWTVNTAGISRLHICYNYYAAEINAGSTYLDASQIYMNPVNCCVYIPERINEACELELRIPAAYVVACGLVAAPSEKEASRTFLATDFHELADSPFIASSTLQHNQYSCEGVDFHLWFQGECRPDWKKLINDFQKFSAEQLKMMKGFPVSAYHFLFQILPHKTYHGVEHITSTVIALGPGYNLLKGALYEDLLGVSCHELFHVWNIKTIRPAEMQPYDYTKENYSSLGYVCEGVTTYYGDYLLYRSGVFTEQQYLQTFDERLQKHYDNPGRFNLSVAESSFDTWLDGYVPGIPNRKTSIYDEGCLLAFVTDMFIRKNSGNKSSLDDVMRHLYTEFALNQKGYTERDYLGLVEHYANTSFSNIFENYIHGTTDYTDLLKEAMAYIGYELAFIPSIKFHEHSLGMKVSEASGICRVISVLPGSVADRAGISINDEMLAVNSLQVKPDISGTTFSEWCSYFGSQNLLLTFSSAGIIKQAEVKPRQNEFYRIAKMIRSSECSDEQKINFEKWKTISIN
ncbi:MAG: M61 family peptidase [Bacteroidota bacterium]|nr:M61 family peptidase [Bacteroidota bacterium]